MNQTLKSKLTFSKKSVSWLHRRSSLIPLIQKYMCVVECLFSLNILKGQSSKFDLLFAWNIEI